VLVCQHCGQRSSQRGTEAISEFRKRKFCSMECAKHGQRRLYGDAHPLYKTDSRRKNRRGKHRAWAGAVISRDNATCQRCGAQNIELHAHHIRSFVDHPELRWELSNGETLCHRCHWDEHSKRGVGEKGDLSEGITASGRAFRRWLGHCAECGAFLSKPFGQVIGKSAVFCNRACRGKWTSRNMKGKSRNLPFPDGRAR
jgi:hypothetical protein